MLRRFDSWLFVIAYYLYLQGYRNFDYGIMHITRSPHLFPELMSCAKSFDVLPPTDFVVSSYSLFRQLSLANVCSIFISIPSLSEVANFRRLLPDLQCVSGPHVIIFCPLIDADPRDIVSSLFDGYRVDVRVVTL